MTKPGDAERPERDDTATAIKAAAILGAIFAVGALGLQGPKSAASVVLGAAIAIANLLTLRAIIRSIFRAPPPEEAADGEKTEEAPRPTNAEHKEAGRRGGWAWGVFAVLKIFILFGGVWILLTRGLVDPIALVVGYGVLPLGIAVGSLWSSLGPQRR